MIEKIGPTIYKGDNIYNNGSGGGGILPEGYKNAIRIFSNGNVSLKFEDLNLDINDTYIYYLSLSLTSTPNTGSGFFVNSSVGNLFPGTPYYSGSGIMPSYYYYNNAQTIGNFINYSGEYTIKITMKKRLCNFNCVFSNYNNNINRNGDYNNTKISYIEFCNTPGNGKNFYGSIYKVIVKNKDDENEIKAEFIPAYNENNILGLFEIKSQQFKGNSNLIE